MVVRRISPLSFAKISGLFYGIIGFIGAAFFSLFMMAGSAIGASASGRSMPFIGAFGAGLAIIILPVIYGLLGFVFGLIGAAVFNVIAGWTGGLELEVQ